MRAVFAVGGEWQVQDVDVPVPRSGEVLIRVHAAGLNFADKMVVRGAHVMGASVTSPASAPTPHAKVPMGGEAAGEVVAVGADVTTFAPGDRVMAMCRGGFADYAIADVDRVMPVPEGVSMTEAAGGPIAFVTAHNALREGSLGTGDAVLVNAASSGVGVAALQLARVLGAGTVIASSTSQNKLDRLAAAGISFDVGVVAGAADFRSSCLDATDGLGVAVIVDNVGASALADNIAVAALGARIVNVGRLGGRNATIDMDELARKRIALIGVTFRTRTAEQTTAVVVSAAADVLGPFADGRLRVLIDRTFPLEEIEVAEAYLAEGRHLGKVVVTTSP